MEAQLSLEFLRVVETAAIAAARTMGFGDGHKADEITVEAMRKTMDSVQMDGTIVIGEGERDEAPMLYIGEKVGLATHAPKALFPQVDIAVDPLEGTNLCATGAPNAIVVLAASERGGLLHAPDLYMEKIVVGPSCKGAVDLDAPVATNLKAIAKRLDRDVEDLVVIVLDRPRHEKLIADIRAAGARIRLIGDGDLSAGISAAVIGTGVHAVMGTGGAPEGVLTAAALRCLNGEIVAQLVVSKPEHEEREAGLTYVPLDQLLRESDFVSLHSPLTRETRHQIGARELRLMKKTAFIVNTARGAIVDEAALVAALTKKQIAGAGLDVFEHEPKIDKALTKMPNVVLTPHLGSATPEVREAMANIVVDNILALLGGHKLPNCVNPQVFAL